MVIATVNPTTGEKLQEFTPLTPAEIETKLALAQASFLDYRTTDISQRSQWLQKAEQILTARSEEFGKIMTLEMGKTLKSAIAEAKKCALVCNYYAENAAEFLADLPAPSDSSKSFIRYQPLGPILAVMPWNFPFWQVFRFAAPSLMAGNVCLLKHASNVPQCALAIKDIFIEAGFPEGVFQTLLITAKQVEKVIRDERVKAATLTGSEAAGASLAAAAGEEIKKTVLELGGSDPFIVLESADVEAAANAAVTARMLNNGQSCIAAKRFILHKAIATEFTKKLVEKFQELRVGDPFDAEIDIGPLATPDILRDLERQVKATVAKGAKVLLGGEPLADTPGNFYPPTILSSLPAGTPAYTEEFFGPVALVFEVDNLDQAIQLANSTSFGLGVSAWTKLETESDRLIDELEAGAVFINGLVKSDPRLPFGGIKRSGYGRELSREGIHEFVNIKTVWLSE